MASPIAVDNTLITQNATVTDATLLVRPVLARPVLARPVLAGPVLARPDSLGSLERCFTLVSFARRL